MVFLAMILSACTIVGHEKVLGWPRMDIVAHYVPAAEMRNRCAPYVAYGMLPEACAEFNFDANRCDMWFNADFPPPASVVEHEKLHCRGYDHIGQRTMAGMLSRHLAVSSASTGATGRQPPAASDAPCKFPDRIYGEHGAMRPARDRPSEAIPGADDEAELGFVVEPPARPERGLLLLN